MNDRYFINYRDFRTAEGAFSKLFCDYVNDFEKVGQYYSGNFHSRENIFGKIPEIKNRYQHRSLVAEVLKEQNKAFGSSERSMENIKYFEEETTFAVVTGQQVGILGGPLYTVYKTITAIKLAQELTTQFPQFKFIPIFWLEGEDHDFNEINVIKLLNAENTHVQVEYLIHGKPLERNIGAAGEIIFDDYLIKFLKETEEILANSEFKKPLFDSIRSFYRPGISFNTAFALIMNKLFGDSGIVFISANDKRLKHILAPVFQREIQEYPHISQIIIERSAELEVSYHAQIKTKALNLFLFHKGGRFHIEPREEGFSLKGVRQHLTKEELLHIAAETPELLSPNVALRPICQDTILPTVAYVGGPAEIAYFAQLQPVYKHFGLTMPIIYPRATATIGEAKVGRILEKYEVDIIDFFDSYDHVSKHVIETISEVDIEELFNNSATRIKDLINEMRFGLNYIDPTLQSPLDTTHEKMAAHLAALKAKVMAAQQIKHETALRQLQKVTHLIYPNGNFQERELNIIYFMNKYGLAFVKWLTDELDYDSFEHQLLWLT